MPVCLTGDVHHMSLQTRDQAYMDTTEIEASLEYARLAEEYDHPVTLFLTGKTVVEEPKRAERLAKMNHVEVGGHNYYAFNTPIHKASRGLLGTWNGPRLFQSWEVSRTVATLTDLGGKVRSWRDHAYRHDSNTPTLLREHGITHFSDVVEPEGDVRETDDLTIVPVNTHPDHEHVYHAFRTPSFVAESDFEGPFGDESYDVDGWCDRVLNRIDSHVEHGRVATVLAHPACMHLADGLETFERLCRTLREQGYETARMCEVSTGE